MNATFNVEKLVQARPDGEPLLRRHWQEIAHYLDIEYAPRWDMYKTLEDAGALRIYTARLDGALIGYDAFSIGRSLHYGSSLEAHEDVLYVAPEHRRGFVGLRLIKFSDEQLRAEGVQLVRRHVKFAHDHFPLLQRLGYEKIDMVVGRRLDLQGGV